MNFRTQRRPSGHLAWLGALALGGAIFFSRPAHAGTCNYSPGTPTYVTADATLAGSISAGRDIPIGTEIYRATFNAGTQMNIDCDPGTYTSTRRLLAIPYPLSSYVHPTYGNRVFQTPVPGIGVVVWNSNRALPTTDTHVFPLKTRLGLEGSLAFDVSLIKIGDVGAGTIRGSDLPTMEMVYTGDNTIRVELGRLIGSLNIVSRTCTTPDVPVDLGSHNLRELSGVGTQTGWVNVPIRLNDCPSFFGAFRNDLTKDGSVSTRSSTENQISYRVDPVTAIVNSSQGVMALQPDGINPTATGIGIQMADGDNNPLRYGRVSPSGLVLTQTNNASYTLNLKARYYQTAATTAAGQANGAATVTLIYQ